VKDLKLGAVMRAMRERQGFSQEELADRLNLSQSCVSKFENNRKSPDFHTMIAWADQTCAKEVLMALVMNGMEGVAVIQTVAHLLGGFILF
jgi:transcriptional regulator with XRE-family HTH domain